MEEKHAIDVTDLVISYQNLKKTSIKKNLQTRLILAQFVDVPSDHWDQQQ